MKRLRVILTGRVQGVGFRYGARRTAESLELTGWIRNAGKAELECEVQGSTDALDQFLIFLLHGPTLAHIEKLALEYHDIVRQETEFFIRETEQDPI